MKDAHRLPCTRLRSMLGESALAERPEHWSAMIARQTDPGRIPPRASKRER